MLSIRVPANFGGEWSRTLAACRESHPVGASAEFAGRESGSAMNAGFKSVRSASTAAAVRPQQFACEDGFESSGAGAP